MACLSFGPMAQCVVHALKDLACHARVTPASSPASHCKQCSALTARRLRFTRAVAPVLLAHDEVTENIKYFSMGPKLRHPAVLQLHACDTADTHILVLALLSMRPLVHPAINTHAGL